MVFQGISPYPEGAFLEMSLLGGGDRPLAGLCLIRRLKCDWDRGLRDTAKLSTSVKNRQPQDLRGMTSRRSHALLDSITAR